jgi:hypothetical protein
MSEKRHFLILARGYCGSLWLAAQLDRHPEISCTAGLYVGLAIPHDSDAALANFAPDQLSAIAAKYAADGIDSQFERLAKRKPARVLGDVHGFRLLSYRRALAAQPHRPAAIGHLVRHPVTLLERIVSENLHRAETAEMREAFVAALPDTANRLRPLLLGTEWPLEKARDIVFLHSALDLFGTALEVAEGNKLGIPLWSFEQLTSDRRTFASLVDFVSAGAVSADEPYLAKVFSAASLDNSGRFRKSSIDRKAAPADIFARWKPHERRLFRSLAERLDFPSLYTPVGYSFDFVAAPAA